MLDVSQEFLDIVDENNHLLGITKSRIQVHKELKDWHRSTGIYIINLQKKFLCQKRSPKKDANPGAWAPHFGGHLKSGQTYLENAVEELKEEIGITVHPDDLMPIYINKNTEYLHFSQIYVYFWNGSESEVTLNDGEVEQVKWLTTEEFELLKQRTTGDIKFRINPQVIDFVFSLKLNTEGAMG